MRKLTVETKTGKYNVVIDSEILKNINRFLPAGKKLFLITNDKVAKLYPDFVSRFKRKIIIKDGEENKNYLTYYYIVEELLKQKIERKDCIVAFGGGVTGDLAGFAASTVLRGVDLVQIPTTLLAQVDSSVGGKTGFNSKYGKNLIGTFYQPKLVLIDPSVLTTLSEKEIKTGFGEIVKYAFIEKNCSDNKEYYLYDYLKNSHIGESGEIAYKCCALKASVVSRDEKESGLRAVLNFGHTFAHAIETITGYREFTHGQAVAMGMKSAFELSFYLGLADKKYLSDAFDLIDKFNLAPVYKINCDKDSYLNIMKSDKKVRNAKIRLILPVVPGKVKIYEGIDEELIKKVI